MDDRTPSTENWHRRRPDPLLVWVSFVAMVVIESAATGLLGETKVPSEMVHRRLFVLPVVIASFLFLGPRFGLDWRNDAGLTPSQFFRSAWRGVGLGLVCGPIILLFNAGVRYFLDRPNQHPALALLEEGGVFAAAEVVLMAVLLAPVAEELFFRGILLGTARAYWGTAAGLVASSVAFGAAHYGTWPDPIPLAVLGALLGVSYLRTGSLWTAIFFHASFNGLMIALQLWFRYRGMGAA